MGIYLNSKSAYRLFKIDAEQPYFVDKSQILEELIPLVEKGGSQICITRPRRFGKTVMANLISSFFSKGCDARDIFEKLHISKSKDYQKHLNQYPVFHISFNKQPRRCISYLDYIDRIEGLLIKDIKTAYPDVEVDESEAVWDILLSLNERDDAAKFIFVLDEWDYIFHQSFVTKEDKGAYLSFLQNLLKDMPYVVFTYMTGILPIAKYSSGSELNMFTEYTMATEEKFSKYFGFTEEETDELYEKYLNSTEKPHLTREGLKSWYDGYYSKTGIRLYNPRSVVTSLKNNNFGNYWTSSGPYDEIYYYIEHNVAAVRDDLALMAAGMSVPVRIWEYAATSMNLQTKEEIFSAMVVYGFLTYKDGEVLIPNRELLDKFSAMLRKEPSLGDVYRLAKASDRMLKATKEGDTETMSQILEDAHDKETPILSYNHETELTAVVNLVYLAARDSYRVEREDKAGKGYVDFIFYPETDKTADCIILELKVDSTPDMAIQQIKDKKYALKFQGKIGEEPRYTGRILAVGISYDREKKEHSCKIEVFNERKIMRKLALSDEILLKIEKPARYIGNEVNSVNKDANEVEIRFAMCFPDVYEIGMSHLGIQILYDMFNRREDVWCERVYSPWLDLDKVMREEKIPLFALESQDPVKDFDFLGITIQYEMCYTNILQILELSQIPMHAKDRTWEHPVVIGGGPCTYNPEPLAEFFDIFYIGEGETVYDELLDLYKASRARGDSREEFLVKAANIEGLYVPMFYEAKYHEDGTLKSFGPVREGIPSIIKKQVVMDMTKAVYPEAPIVPFIKATQDRVVLEIQRGCIRGCRFCQAGMLYRPTRERGVDTLKEYAKVMLKNTGHEEISLSSLSSSDYSQLKELVDFLIEEFKGEGVNISLPSLRIDAFSLDVMSQVQDIRRSSLTFAPEAGSQRLRDVINKGLTEEIILDGAGQAFEGGWSKVKLYFMLGLPTETEEDMKEIARLADKIARRYYEIPKEERHGKCQITASSSFFVPKPFTPFQWASMCTSEEYIHRAYVVKHEFQEQLNRKSLKYNWHEADVTVLEGVFARGDRKVGKVIEEAYRLGCLYDSWTESFHNEPWMEAFDNMGVDIEFYTTRKRELDELLPWDFIDIGVSKQFLKKEWERAESGTVTPNCRMQCSGCGAAQFGGGVCYEGKN